MNCIYAIIIFFPCTSKFISYDIPLPSTGGDTDLQVAPTQRPLSLGTLKPVFPTPLQGCLLFLTLSNFVPEVSNYTPHDTHI